MGIENSVLSKKAVDNRFMIAPQERDPSGRCHALLVGSATGKKPGVQFEKIYQKGEPSGSPFWLVEL